MTPKRVWPVLAFVCVIAVLLTGCDDYSNHNISHSLTLTQPIRLNQPTTATVSVDFREDVQGVGVSLYGSGAGWKGEVTFKYWDVGQVAMGRHLELSAPITFTVPGNYDLLASVHTNLGSFNVTSLYLYVDQSGAVFNPTPQYGPGTPVPASTVSIQILSTPAAKFTSPLPTRTLSPRASPLPSSVAQAPVALAKGTEVVPLVITGAPMVYEELAQGSAGIYGKPLSPHLAVITGPQSLNQEDVKALTIKPEILQTLDYSRFWVLVAFREWHQSGGYSIHIRQVSRDANVVFVYAELSELRPDQVRPAAYWIAYDAVKVEKAGVAGQQMTFRLVISGTVVSSVTERVP